MKIKQKSGATLPCTACSPLRVLRLTLKKKWFDLIASGQKKEEYRKPGRWIESRVNDLKQYDAVEFRNGYGPDAPKVLVEYKGFRNGWGRISLGAEPGVHYLVILLGEIIPENA
jgi:hypothetical protein